MNRTKVEKVQIDQSLFFDLYHLALMCPDHFNPTYNRAIKACREKTARIVNRFLYTTYKTDPSPEVRSRARQEYLNRIGCPESFRWPDESDVNVSRSEEQRILQHDLPDYLIRFPDISEDEKEDLRQWVASGNSPYENGYNLCDDSGRPMDFISARRCIMEMAEEHKQNPDSFWTF